MQTENRLFDDLARVAGGAFSTLTSLREEIETRVRERVERLLADMDLVPREEFEAVKAMAQKARMEQEAMAERLAVLERRLETETRAKKPARPVAERRVRVNYIDTSGAWTNRLRPEQGFGRVLLMGGRAPVRPPARPPQRRW
jgi:BMFP domain-containing protein YqiC